MPSPQYFRLPSSSAALGTNGSITSGQKMAGWTIASPLQHASLPATCRASSKYFSPYCYFTCKQGKRPFVALKKSNAE
jgi:hypothetical protein